MEILPAMQGSNLKGELLLSAVLPLLKLLSMAAIGLLLAHPKYQLVPKHTFPFLMICRPPPQFFRFTVIMTAFGNTGNLPLAIVASVCHSDDNLFGTEDDCTEAGVAYVSFSQWVSVILVYTLVYHMMERTLESGVYAVVEEEENHEMRNWVRIRMGMGMGIEMKMILLGRSSLRLNGLELRIRKLNIARHPLLQLYTEF